MTGDLLREVLAGNRRWAVVEGDCLAELRAMPGESVDAVVTDPPAGIGFMGKTWDKPGTLGVSGGVAMPSTTSSRNPSCRECGGRKRAGKATNACECEVPDWNDVEHRLRDRARFIEFMRAILAECLRVLKPGAHGLVWALPRTSHWTAMALEDAGFEVRDRVAHFFASGFPKSLNVSKAIDAHFGLKREPDEYTGANFKNEVYGRGMGGGATLRRGTATHPSAVKWDGWHSALKPAVEDWWLVRKPLIGTIAENVLAHGTGGINVGACRIEGVKPKLQNIGNDTGMWGLGGRTAAEVSTEGRWPANLVLSHSPSCRLRGTRVVQTGTGAAGGDDPAESPIYGKVRSGRSTVAHAQDGIEEVEDWECDDSCPVRMLDEQSRALGPAGRISGSEPTAAGLSGPVLGGPGTRTSPAPFYGDRRGASRFFFVSKPSSFERDAGLDGLPTYDPGELTGRVAGRPGTTNPRAGASASASGGRANRHPTVKSVALMRYLVRLVTPPGGTVLDCFAGSGTTGCAALLEGFRFVGVEREAEYVPILEARLRYAAQRPVGGEYAPGERDEVLPGQLKLL